MTDLLSLAPKSDTFVVEVKHPVTEDPLLKDDGTPMTITIYLPHSAEYKQIVHDRTNKFIQRTARGKKNSSLTASEIEDMTLDLIVKTTKDWNIQLGDKTPKYSEDVARDVYSRLPWLKAQVVEAQDDFEAHLGN